jgi:hypothetical protein
MSSIGPEKNSKGFKFKDSTLPWQKENSFD